MTGTQGDISVGSATLPKITYSADSITASGIYPGWSSGEKTATISVDDSGTGKFKYECSLNVTRNDKFKDLELTVTAGTGATIDTGVQSPKTLSFEDGESGVQTIKLASGTIEATGSATSHTFTYKLNFKDTEIDQKEQQGASIAATVTCELSGEKHYTQSDQE